MKFVKKKDDKKWFHIDYKYNGTTLTWSPKLRDLFKIIVGIFKAEEENYPPENGYRGAEMTMEAINEVLSHVKVNGLVGLSECLDEIENKYDPNKKYTGEKLTWTDQDDEKFEKFSQGELR